MENRITNYKKAPSDVLLEHTEPLFPEEYGKRRLYMRRIISIILSVVFLGAVIYGSRRVYINVPHSTNRPEDDSGANGQIAPPSVDTSDNYEITSEKESDSKVFEKTETESPEESVQTEHISDCNDQTEGGADDKIEDVSIPALDFSQVEMGDRFILNYTDKSIDIEGLIDSGFMPVIQEGNRAPTVLIIHTHTSEEYRATGKHSGLNSVVSVGEKINERLNYMEISSVHCTVIHDNSDVNAYAMARDTIDTMLEIYPDIRCIIDIHRMASLTLGGEVARPVSPTHGGAAQVRLTVSTNSSAYGVWQENLSLALSIRGALNSENKKLCMPIVVTDTMLNSDKSLYYLMIDVGSQDNYTAEAVKAGEYLALALATVLTKGG